MTRLACIDIGTVTARLAVADVEDGRIVRLAKHSEICNLGQDVDATGRLADEAIERVAACVGGYVQAAREAGAVAACCTLTSAARDAENSAVLGAGLDTLGLDPLIILMSLPVAFAGILWMLFLTGTTFNVPSLMGSIMTIGVATANSILMVVFANDERVAGKNNIEAAENAGFTRLRPVLMTALAMIIGMLPMALALGEGGEQNAPLGRAVIGGLLFATTGTLFVVPIMYAWLHKDPPKDYEAEIAQAEQEEAEEQKRAAQARQGGGNAQPQTA